ncbi:MAG: hypothetical protein CMQ20_06710 [Gammaproteobacteria bacterium]|nr:hypothetical protein [Gammaproteobacteria bacterium]|tara:strand:- start:1271 stop:1477 length:207 start_codon:yes stop_codon:yes gene_type:complete
MSSFNVFWVIPSFSLEYSLYLIGFSKNLALPIERTPLNHSYGYDSADVSPICFAGFLLNSDPFMNYPG